MSDTTTIVLAVISTVGGIVSTWMANRSKTHATTASTAQSQAQSAALYVAHSLRPPNMPDDFKIDPPKSS